MLKLDAQKEPFWLDILPGRTVQNGKAAETIPAQRTRFKPLTTVIVLAARAEAAKVALAAIPQKGDGEIVDEALLSIAVAAAQAAGEEAFIRTCAILGIDAWEGVGDHEDKPLPVTPANIAAYVGNWRVYDAINAKYVNPGLVRADEKNAFAPSRTGTSGARTRAKATVGTAAKRARTARTT
jgi:hypothetical protein